jgi:hypothetical protein
MRTVTILVLDSASRGGKMIASDMGIASSTARRPPSAIAVSGVALEGVHLEIFAAKLGTR